MEKGIEIVCHYNNYYCFVLTAAKVVTWELLGNAGYNNYNIAVSKTWYLYRSYWVRSGISTGGQYNSKEGCKPYSIAKCDHHVTGNFIADYCIYTQLCDSHYFLLRPVSILFWWDGEHPKLLHCMPVKLQCGVCQRQTLWREILLDQWIG